MRDNDQIFPFFPKNVNKKFNGFPCGVKRKEKLGGRLTKCFPYFPVNCKKFKGNTGRGREISHTFSAVDVRKSQLSASYLKLWVILQLCYKVYTIELMICFIMFNRFMK